MTDPISISIDAEAAVAAADRMTEAVLELGKRFDTLRADTKSETTFLRRLLKAFAIVVVVDICLSVAALGFGYEIRNVANQAHQASSTAKQTHAALVTQCEASNASRADLRVLLAAAYSGSSAPRDANTQVQFAAFVATLNAKFGNRDCSVIK